MSSVAAQSFPLLLPVPKFQEGLFVFPSKARQLTVVVAVVFVLKCRKADWNSSSRKKRLDAKKRSISSRAGCN